MKRRLTAALIAAISWTPLAAYAQGKPQRGAWPGARESRPDQRLPRPEHVEGSSDGGWQQQPAPTPDASTGGRERRSVEAPGGGRLPNARPYQPGSDDRTGRPQSRAYGDRNRGDAALDRDRARAWQSRWLERRRQWGGNITDWRDHARDDYRFAERQDWMARTNARDWAARAGSFRDRPSFGSGNAAWTPEWRRNPRYDWTRHRVSNRAAFHLPRYYAPPGWQQGYRRFSIGMAVAPVLFTQDYWIDDPYAYRLPDPYGPLRWVRYYNDALLVDIESGEVVDAISDIFW